MPADDCPSFHCRPSTASTFFPLLFSIRQKPTTGTSDFGSAPTVSLEKSIVVSCAARPGRASAARPLTAAISGPTFQPLSIIALLHSNPPRRTRHPAPPPPQP